MNWAKLWIKLFGTTTWLGVDIGFWVSMGMSLLVAVIMVIVFWSMKPLPREGEKKQTAPGKADRKKTANPAESAASGVRNQAGESEN